MENPIWTARYRSRSNTLNNKLQKTKTSAETCTVRVRENTKMSTNEVIPRRSLNADAIAAKITVFYRVSDKLRYYDVIINDS